MSIFSGAYEGRLRSAFDSECRKRNLELLLVYGQALDGQEPTSAAHNSIFEYVHPDRVQGVILISPVLSALCSKQRISEFAQRYAGLPSCSLGLALPEMPSIEIDNRNGMEALVEHLVVAHGRRNLVYLGGHAGQCDSELRYSVMRAVLARHGIDASESPTIQGGFVSHGGRRVTAKLLAQGARMDAIVAANDAMALGAASALRQHGLRIPDDVIVTGFDDLIHARLCNPPLTTVAQPYEELARSALDVVQAQWEGRSVPPLTVLPTRFIPRQSCGCGAIAFSAPSRVYSGAAEPGGAPPSSPATQFAHARPEIEPRLGELLDVGEGNGAHDAERLLDGLEAELGGGSGAMLAIVLTLLHESDTDAERHRVIDDALTLIARQLVLPPHHELEQLWQRLRREVVLSLTEAHLQVRLELDHNYVQLLGTAAALYATHDLKELQRELGTLLPNVGVESAYLSRFEEDDPSQLVCFGIFDGRGTPLDSEPFPAHMLYPPRLDTPHERRTMVVSPLVFEDRCLGVAVFGYHQGSVGYQLLRDQLSAALGSTLLAEEVSRQIALKERSVHERIATTQRMESLGVLAGGVAHDLNNALGPLVALPELMIEQLATLSGSEEVKQDLVGDLESFRSASQHASQTIKDLLTLSRQGRTPKTTLELNRLAADCAKAFAITRGDAGSGGPRLELDTCPAPVTVLGSESHLLRSVGNLLINAADASGEGGRILLRVSAVRLTEPRLGYDTVAPGHYAVIEVSDEGQGLPEAERHRIFEPFFSTKRPGTHSGTGLGLAIVHGVVKEHEGFIDVESRPGAGTTFSLFLPRADARLSSAPSPPPPKRGQGKILVVDDDPIQLRTCQRVLARLGFEVTTLASGAEASRVFERAALSTRSPFDLVILDMLLHEGQDGLEVYEEIRQRFPAQKAILVSGHAPTERVELAVERGLPWLAKPYTVDALTRSVHAALAGQTLGTVMRVSSRPPDT